MSARMVRITATVVVAVCWAVAGGLLTARLGQQRLQESLYAPAEAFAADLLDVWAADQSLDAIDQALGATTGFDPEGAMPVPQGGPAALPLPDPSALLFQYGSPAYLIDGPGGGIAISTGMRVTQQRPHPPLPDRPGTYVDPVELPAGASFDQVPTDLETHAVCRAREVNGAGLVQLCVLLDPKVADARIWDAYAPVVALIVLGGVLVVGGVALLVPRSGVRRVLAAIARRRRRLGVCALVGLVAGLVAGGIAFGPVESRWEYAVADTGARTLTNYNGIGSPDRWPVGVLVPPFGDPGILLRADNGEPLFTIVDATGGVSETNVSSDVSNQVVPHVVSNDHGFRFGNGGHTLRTWPGIASLSVKWPADTGAGASVGGHRVTALCGLNGLLSEGGGWLCVFVNPRLAHHATARAVGQVGTVAAAGGLGAGLAAWLVIALAASPLTRIRRLAVTATRDDEPQLIPRTGSGDEADQVAGVINETIGRLQHSLESQRRFVADAAHELRSPVATLINTVEVADRYPQLTDRAEVDAVVLRQAHRIETLTQDLLLLAGMDAKAPLRRDAVDLAEVAEEAVAARDSPRVPVRFLPGVLPTVLGDQAAFGRVVGNLVDNAVRHAATEVRVTLRSSAENVGVTVHNDGIPIPAADQERIFARFTRLDEARDRDAGGTGLGLAIARETARRYGGDVTVRSGDGEGTTFTLTLPRPR